jgi:chromosome partitioning protein
MLRYVFLCLGEALVAISDIPLTWETLALVGTPLTAAAAGAWIVGRASSQGEARALKVENDFLRLRLNVTEADRDKYHAGLQEVQQRMIELSAQYATLLDSLKTTPSGSSDARKSLQLVTELQARLKQFDGLRDAVVAGTEEDVWNLLSNIPPASFEKRMRESRLKVLVVANLKGGVGKTTLVANLAAFFAKKLKKRVLVIDFDHQGSLTRMMLLGVQTALGSGILADTLLAGQIVGKWVADHATKLGTELPATQLITCGPTFEAFEFRLFLRGLIGETQDDVRYRLVSLLLSNEVQSAFDIVLIDAPPRSTAGTLNALFAAHALIVPTVLDDLAVDAVGRFLQRCNRYRQFNPALRQAAIVGTLTQFASLTADELSAREGLQMGLAYWGAESHIINRNILHFTALARAAGKEIGYLEDRAVRRAFDELGTEIVERLKI